MGIFSKVKEKVSGAKQGYQERQERRQERQHYKHEMEREKFREGREKFAEAKQYYQDKRAYEQEKRQYHEDKIKATPIVGRIYTGAQGFSGSKFAKATINELRDMGRPQQAPRKTGRRSSRRPRQTSQYNQPALFQPAAAYGYNPVDESLRLQSATANRMPSIGQIPQSRRQSRGNSGPSISPFGGINFPEPKLDPKLRKMMGV